MKENEDFMETGEALEIVHAFMSIMNGETNNDNPEPMHPIDQCYSAWFDAIPDNVYDPCPCGCNMKWRFAVKNGIDEHEARFIANYKKEHGMV